MRRRGTVQQLLRRLVPVEQEADDEGDPSESLLEDPSFADLMKELSRADGAGWKRYWCAWLPGAGFPPELDRGFREWFHAEYVCKKLPRRIARQARILVSLTAIEFAYVFCKWEGFKSPEELLKASRVLWRYLLCRVGCFLVLGIWQSLAQHAHCLLRRPRAVEMGILASTWIVAVLLFFSYNWLPSAYPGEPVYGPRGDPVYGRNAFLLLCFPLYAVATAAHPMLFLPACSFVPLSLALALLHVRGFLEGVILSHLGLFIFALSSLLRAFETYMVEVGLRKRYRVARGMSTTSDRIEGVLKTLLPPLVAQELWASRAGSIAPSHRYFRATVTQCDLCGFTGLSSARSAEEVVEMVSEIFGLFDGLTNLHDVYKVETVGDAYIAGRAELPLTCKSEPMGVVHFGLDMIRAIRQWARRRKVALGCRVGIHFGECVGGIVGTEMQRYHLFGSLMHELELLEATAPENRVQVSSACHDAVQGELLAEMHSGESLQFQRRLDPCLRTSKGEVHRYDEVKGPTFFASGHVRQWRKSNVLAARSLSVIVPSTTSTALLRGRSV